MTLASAKPSEHGRVTLVGAGPGDPEQLTLKAVRALQDADVILFDALVSDAVLDFARREARRLLVGKRGHRESCRQDDINALMVRLARQGRRIVRLKGGDPSVFGRSGEEIEYLEEHGIPVDIVPGITAASAAAARLGISLTHRDKAHSVRFVTGHGKSGALSDDLDWNGLADPDTSLVFYMANRTAAQVAERLLKAGLSPATPSAIVARATRPGERVWRGDLAALAERRAAKFEGPVILCVGAVFERAGACADTGPYLFAQGEELRIHESSIGAASVN